MLQLISFSIVFSYVCDFNIRDKFLKQGYQIIKFVKFFFPNSELIVKCNIGFKLTCNRLYGSQYFMVISLQIQKNYWKTSF